MTGRTWLVWSWPLRPVPVTECALCGAWTSADATDAHARWHRSLTTGDRADRPDPA